MPLSLYPTCPLRSPPDLSRFYAVLSIVGFYVQQHSAIQDVQVLYLDSRPFPTHHARSVCNFRDFNIPA